MLLSNMEDLTVELKRLIEEVKKIHEEVNDIKEELAQVRKGTDRMNNHISFIESLYQKFEYPLEYIRNKVSGTKAIQ